MHMFDYKAKMYTFLFWGTFLHFAYITFLGLDVEKNSRINIKIGIAGQDKIICGFCLENEFNCDS